MPRRNNDIQAIQISCFSSVIHILIDFSNNRCYALSLSRYFSNQFPGQNQERTRPTAAVRLHNMQTLHMPLLIYTLLYILYRHIQIKYMTCSILEYESDRNVVERECAT